MARVTAFYTAIIDFIEDHPHLALWTAVSILFAAVAWR